MLVRKRKEDNRLLRRRGTGVSLTLQPVVLALGESTSGFGGALDTVTELNYLYPTDANIKIYDAAGLMAVGAAIRSLKQATLSTVTMTIASPCVVTWNAHGLSDGDPIVLYTTGALPTGLTASTTRYYAANSSANSFSLAATRGGAAINTSGTQSGTHTAVANGGHEQQPGGAAYVDPTFPAAPGDSGEFSLVYRSVIPSARLDLVPFQRGGGRFSDLNGTFGRAVNYKYNLTDGAYNELKNVWSAYVALLAAEGKSPSLQKVFITLGGNTAGDVTESSTFQTDLGNLISQGRIDIWGNTTVVLERLSNLQTGTNATNRATIRTATENLVLADPTRMELLDMDGMPCEVDGVHFRAASHTLRGKRRAHSTLGLWYPAKPSLQLGDPQYALRHWDFNDQFNSISGGLISSVPDVITNTGGMSASTTARPTAATRVLANGFTQRLATFDGVANTVSNLVPIAINRSGGFILFFHIKAAAVNNGAIFCEGTEAGTTRLFAIRSDASNNACITIVDDAGANPLSLAPIINGLLDNTNRTGIITYDGATTFTGYKDGVLSTTQTYNKTAISVNNTTIGSTKVNGSFGGFYAMSMGELGIMQYSPTNLSTLISNVNSYLNRLNV